MEKASSAPVRPREGRTMRTNREGALRIDQRLNEQPDIWAMRAFVKALPYIDQNTALAAAEWMRAISLDPKTWKRETPEEIAFGTAAKEPQ